MRIFIAAILDAQEVENCFTQESHLLTSGM